MKIKKNLKDFWNWLWKSESIWSYIVFLIIIFVVVKFIFLPGLGLIFQTSLPLAIVESSSMEHYSLAEATGAYTICGIESTESKFFNLDDYWQTCGSWYEQNTNITKAEFQNFKFKDGFRKGDLMVVFGKQNPEIGDIIIFNAGRSHPIIHRIISLYPIQTKGDHNPAQLPEEKNIDGSQVVGVAVARVPYVGWVKLFFVELWQKIAG
jgi:hypothetical protein